MAFTAANHYDFSGDDITGTVDAHRSAGVWAAQLVLSGETLESTDVTRSDLGFEVRTVVKTLSDGDRTHLLVVLPRVTIDNGDTQPATFTSYAVLYTVHDGSTDQHGVAESYDMRALSGTASLVR
ncbi:hypothetical protein CH275_09170 [Rhodococcus sp. 06-235-1A]|uniref:hypothetical protein n=1 Tax=Rhodococcus sp. 06-235-1A TaxID=2022508 RepID=UPI000B9BD8B0|nr:hypothetical protein [Rhodococcus sp. 06-235-1A]OZD07296.1 hypothetical protein CH275_09170 [Rhodococcus sp. 06-235-1A]